MRWVFKKRKYFNSYLYLNWFVLSQLIKVTAISRAAVSVQPLDHTQPLRLYWSLWPCVEGPEGSRCVFVLQTVASWLISVHHQELPRLQFYDPAFVNRTKAALPGCCWGGEGLPTQKTQVTASDHTYSVCCPFCISLNKNSVEQTSSRYICYLKNFNAF